MWRAVLVFAVACGSSQSAPHGKLELVDAPATQDIAPLVATEATKAQHDGKRLIVYVGASWCEPCQEIHHAIEQHKLDAEFPDLTLLAFDLDRDGSRLSLDGYDSELIPLFALPGPDGRASGKKEFGGKKGVDNVPLLTAKLHHLLDQK